MRRWSLLAALVLAACGTAAPRDTDTEPDVDTVDLIDPAVAARGALLDVRASGCGPRVGFGTATLIDDGVALTAAHVVAGADAVSVIDLDGAEHRALVVWFDPDLDVAALSVPTDVARPVRLRPDDDTTGDDTTGDDSPDIDEIERGVIAVSRGAFDARVVTTVDVDVPRHVNVRTTDIYREDEVVRPGFEIAGDIEPGDSGTMVIAADGAAGLVWSRSSATDGRAWAVDIPDDFRRDAFRTSLDTEVDRGPCLR